MLANQQIPHQFGNNNFYSQSGSIPTVSTFDPKNSQNQQQPSAYQRASATPDDRSSSSISSSMRRPNVYNSGVASLQNLQHAIPATQPSQLNFNYGNEFDP